MRAELGVLIAVVIFGGCDGGQNRSNRETGPPGSEQFGRLPGLSATTSLELRSELARIVEEGGTPEQLMRPKVPDDENVAAGLGRLFREAEIPSLLGSSSELYPTGNFVFTAVALEKAVRLKERYASQLEAARQSLQRPRCDFGIDLGAGFSADLSCIDVVRICARLEAFAAAECLAGADLDGTVDSAEYMLRLASCLAAEHHVTARLEAALVRINALGVLRATVTHPGIAITHLERIANRFSEELAAWPNDASAWIGDRALGLHAYEVVRAGQAAALLTEEEIVQFTEEGILEEFSPRARRTVDEDELYYLRAMRKIIDSCTQPYYARLPAFADLRNDLQQRRNSADFPMVAGRLLLRGVEQGHTIQAQDRASCEAWAIALSVATGRPRPPYEINPLTRKNYRVEREKGWVRVGNVSEAEGGSPSNVVVPDLAGKSSDVQGGNRSQGGNAGERPEGSRTSSNAS